MALNFPDSPVDGQVYTSGTRSWTWDAARASWLVSTPVSVFPSQAGNSGKFLTTDGSNVSWTSTVLPNVSGYLWVNAANGSDTTGTRNNPLLPFATVFAAITAATAGDIIYIAAGTYTPLGTENWATKSITLVFAENTTVSCIATGGSYNRTFPLFWFTTTAKNVYVYGKATWIMGVNGGTWTTSSMLVNGTINSCVFWFEAYDLQQVNQRGSTSGFVWIDAAGSGQFNGSTIYIKSTYCTRYDPHDGEMFYSSKGGTFVFEYFSGPFQSVTAGAFASDGGMNVEIGTLTGANSCWLYRGASANANTTFVIKRNNIFQNDTSSALVKGVSNVNMGTVNFIFQQNAQNCNRIFFAASNNDLYGTIKITGAYILYGVTLAATANSGTLELRNCVLNYGNNTTSGIVIPSGASNKKIVLKNTMISTAASNASIDNQTGSAITVYGNGSVTMNYDVGGTVNFVGPTKVVDSTIPAI